MATVNISRKFTYFGMALPLPAHIACPCWRLWFSPCGKLLVSGQEKPSICHRNGASRNENRRHRSSIQLRLYRNPARPQDLNSLLDHHRLFRSDQPHLHQPCDATPCGRTSCRILPRIKLHARMPSRPVRTTQGDRCDAVKEMRIAFSKPAPRFNLSNLHPL
jgi:hypothetical protein